jgi:hypothetical protein
MPGAAVTLLVLQDSVIPTDDLYSACETLRRLFHTRVPPMLNEFDFHSIGGNLWLLLPFG